jgi:hypothetical protein
MHIVYSYFRATATKAGAPEPWLGGGASYNFTKSYSKNNNFYMTNSSHLFLKLANISII